MEPIVFVLIGMSGLGKSHWSRQLEKIGFKRYCCDEMISQRLVHYLKTSNGSVVDLGHWMGFPYDPDYGQKAQLYLDAENQVLEEIVHELSHEKASGHHVVVDTTGSFIYTDPKRIDMLRSLGRLVHLAVSFEHQHMMVTRYRQQPRPVIWGELFQPHPGEKPEDTLVRCYSDLLRFREKRYCQLAHQSIAYAIHTDNQLDPWAFLKIAKG